MFNSELFLHISSMRVSWKVVIDGMKAASSIGFNKSVQSRAGATRISVIRPVRPISHKKCLVTAVAGASARSLTAFQPERSLQICIRGTNISALSGLIKHDIVIMLSAIIWSILHLGCMHTIVMPSECTWRWLILTSFMICDTSKGGLIIMCRSLLSTLPHPQTSWASPDSLITLEGVANDARLYFSKSFRTLFTISRISLISAIISGTTKAAYVRTLPIDAQ